MRTILFAERAEFLTLRSSPNHFFQDGQMSFTIKNCDDCEKLKKYKESKERLSKKQLKEKVGEQNFSYDMGKVFEPSIKLQKEITKAVTEGNQTLQTTMGSIAPLTQRLTTGLEKFDSLLPHLNNSNIAYSSIVISLSNLNNNKRSSQFGSTHLKDI